MTTSAKIFKSKVYEGVHDFLRGRGGGRYITQIYIPSEKFMINLAGAFNVYKADEIPDGARDVNDIEIPNKIVEKLKKYVKMRKFLERNVSLLISDEESEKEDEDECESGDE